MSEQYEPSYYEIALTGRQVLVAFVILLVCLVAAFFSGVWMGRGELGGPGGGAEVAERTDGSSADGFEDVAPSAPAEDASGAGGEPGSPEEDQQPGAGSDELSFFDDGAPSDGAGEPPARPSAERAEEPATEEAEPPERPESRPPIDEGDGPSTADNPRETVNPSGTLAGGDVVIQVFSSADQAKAQEILERLHANDFRAFISPVSDGGATFYRVRVGPFEHQEDAERMAAELRRRLDMDTWITR